MSDGFIFGDNGDVKDFITFLIRKLPPEIQAKVREECIIITISGSLDGFYIPSYMVNDRAVIVMDFLLYSSDPYRFIRTFYHEIAHHMLKHKVLFGVNQTLEIHQENEANRLVSDWLLRAEVKSI